MQNLKTILADVYPRDNEQPAIERARQLAAATGASIHLLLCDYQESFTEGMLMDNEQIEGVREQYLSELRSWLEERSAALAREGIKGTTELVWHSPRYESILEKAAELDADVIVRAAKKHSKIARLLFGATDWELIRRAPQPVWIVKKALDPLSRGLRVLAAVDPVHPRDKGSNLDNKLVETADNLVKHFGGEMHVFHAYNAGAALSPVAPAGQLTGMPVVTVGAELLQEMRKIREKQMTELVQPFGIPERNVHLVAGSTAAALDDTVEELGIDVVVAGAVSRGRFERLLIGSTAEEILDAVHCDVVVVKPDGFPQPAQVS